MAQRDILGLPFLTIRHTLHISVMPAFKFSSLLHKDKSDSSSRRSSMASDVSSITSDPLVSSPIDDPRQGISSDGARSTSTNQLLSGSDLSEGGVTDVDMSHRSHTSGPRGLTLDMAKANDRNLAVPDYSSSDDMDTPLASRSESELFQVRSRNSTHAPSAQAIITQPISVEGLGPVIPQTSNTQTLTPAQEVVFAVQSASPSGSSQEVTPSTTFLPTFEGRSMQSPVGTSVNGSTMLQPNVDASADRSPKSAGALLLPTQETTTSRRFSSSSKKRPASVNILPGGPAPPIHTAPAAGSSTQSVMSLPAPDNSVPHTPAELLSIVKSKVRPHRSGSRASKNALETESLPPGVIEPMRRKKKMGKRERLKARLRASSDAFSLRSDDHDTNDSFGDESDTSEESGSDDEDDDDDDDDDDDSRSVATRNSRFSHADLPVHGFAVASNKRNIEFHALFPEIDEGDYLIDGEHVTRKSFEGPLFIAPPQITDVHCKRIFWFKAGFTFLNTTCLSMPTSLGGSPT